MIAGVFDEFAEGRAVTPAPWPRIPYDTAMLDYGSDKPDLRNPLAIRDVTQHFAGSGVRTVRTHRGVAAAWCGRSRRPARHRTRAASSTS